MKVRATLIGNTSRSMLFMASWIIDHAPEKAEAIYKGTIKLTPTYRRLKRECDLAVFKFLQGSNARDLLSQGYTIDESRQDGRFVFEWRPSR